MAYFVVTYDLIKEKNYTRIIDRLTELSAEKAALSVWLVELNNTAGEVRDDLQGYMDDDDKLIVIEFDKRPRYTRAFTAAADWIKARFG